LWNRKGVGIGEEHYGRWKKRKREVAIERKKSCFSNSPKRHQVKTKKITTVKEVWIPTRSLN